MKTATNQFEKLSLNQKYALVKEEADFIASRIYQDFNIHLFALNGFYVEVWKKLGLNYIYWIDVVNSQHTLSEYLDNIKLPAFYEK